MKTLSPVLEFSNLTIFDPKNDFKIFGKVKTVKAPVGFGIITYTVLVNSPTHCANLLGNNFGKEYAWFYCLFRSTSQYGGVQYHL